METRGFRPGDVLSIWDEERYDGNENATNVNTCI